MSQPIVFISHFQIKEGKAAALRALTGTNAARLESGKPRTLTFLVYADENGQRISIVHVFADAESMDLHTEGVEDRSREAYELLEPLGWEIYGQPSASVVEMMQRIAKSAGAPLTIDPEYVSGFLRLGPA